MSFYFVNRSLSTAALMCLLCRFEIGFAVVDSCIAQADKSGTACSVLRVCLDVSRSQIIPEGLFRPSGGYPGRRRIYDRLMC